MEEEFELETSALSQTLSDNGSTVDVQIYRGGDSEPPRLFCRRR